MDERPEHTITRLLDAAAGGDQDALASLFGRVYEELRGLAHEVREGRAGETLNTTALVHEAYLKLAGADPVSVRGRAHFFALAGRVMRQVVVDAARRRLAARRGADAVLVSYDDDLHAAPLRADVLIALDDALDRLAAADSRRAQIVEHRVFAGLTTAATAELLGLSTATVERDWRAARAWLALELAERR